MFYGLDHLARAELGVTEYLREVTDGAARNAFGVERANPLGSRSRPQPLAEDWLERLVVLDAHAVGREALISGEIC